MQKTDYNLRLLTVIFIVSLIISNVVTSKLVNTGLVFNGVLMILPGAMFCYALTFLMTDVIGEIWGKKQANECVKLGFLAQLIALVLIQLTRYLPAYSTEMQNAYITVLGQSWIFVIASLLAYYAAQSWDVFIFHKIRDHFNGNPNQRWIWNNLSTLTSQMIDTVIFITIAFGIGYGWILNNVKMLGLMIIGQYIFKGILAILDTPFFYVMTSKQANEQVQEDLKIQDMVRQTRLVKLHLKRIEDNNYSGYSITDFNDLKQVEQILEQVAPLNTEKVWR